MFRGKRLTFTEFRHRLAFALTSGVLDRVTRDLPFRGSGRPRERNASLSLEKFYLVRIIDKPILILILCFNYGSDLWSIPYRADIIALEV